MSRTSSREKCSNKKRCFGERLFSMLRLSTCGKVAMTPATCDRFSPTCSSHVTVGFNLASMLYPNT